MGKNGFAPQRAALGLVLCCAGLTAYAQGEDPSFMKAGTMKLVQGDVRVVDAKGERRLQPGDALQPADNVVTGGGGSASLVLRDGTTIMVGPASRMNLSTFAFNSTTQDGSLVVDLVRGSMRMISGLIAKANPQAVAVRTRTATIGVRGTDFIVQVDDDPAAK